VAGEDPVAARRALAVRERGLTPLEVIVLADELPTAASADFDLEAVSARVSPDDLATLIYTSGATGPPKGVDLTHRNVVAQVGAMREALGLAPHQRVISWLPMAHIAERLCTHYVPMLLGWSVTCLDEPRGVAALLPEVRPQFFFSPPRLWEKRRATGRALAQLGLDRTRVAVVGAAPCPPEVVEYFRGLALPLCEVYGMSETTGVATINPPAAIRVGTVGTVLPGVEVALSEQGPHARPGGHARLPQPGRCHRGGDRRRRLAALRRRRAFDDDGYLRVVDRIKELIINAAGKNMSPANIEAAIKSAGSVIANVCAIGDGRPYNVALVTLDPDPPRRSTATSPPRSRRRSGGPTSASPASSRSSASPCSKPTGCREATS
jgi:long-subunit acyl-CoA synthetase (AMP-forming)